MIEITKSVLKQYKKSKLKAQIIKNQLDSMEQEGNSIAGTIINYSRGRKHVENIIDFDWDYYGQLSEELAYENEIVESVEQFIKSIKDAETREVFRLKYIEGLTWIQISNRLYHGMYTCDYVRQIIHNRYMKKMNIQ